MPTPKEWQENLERIQSFSGGKAIREIAEDGQDPVEKVSGLDNSLENIMAGSELLADRLMGLLGEAPEDAHREVISGFLTGVILSVVSIIAESNFGREDNDKSSDA